ncbi:MAG: alpha/beta hydrolase [Prochloraceae cyanobacterium]|nr:alpha/beta hydrolase [Prochloraceae cyanobacterium]
MIKTKLFNPVGISLISFFVIFSSSQKARAAESVILNYGPFQEDISVRELSDLARNGRASRSLKAYLRMANRDPEDLQKLLTKKVKVDPIAASKFFNQLPGELLLDGVSQVIRTPSQRASRQSMRAALVGSALPDGEIQLIEVLENYPTQEVYVEGDRLVNAYNQISGVLGGISKFRSLLD